jgi:hypothetical protein
MWGLGRVALNARGKLEDWKRNVCNSLYQNRCQPFNAIQTQCFLYRYHTPENQCYLTSQTLLKNTMNTPDLSI